MSSPICHNCGQSLAASYSFCPACGQKTSIHRLSWHDVQHDLLHFLTHADKGIFSLVKQLALRPGYLAADYVQGMRKKYFNPFTFFMVMVGISVFMLHYTGFVSFAKSIPRVGSMFDQKINLIIMLNVPVLAFWNRIMFRKNGRNFIEHLVLAAYTSGARSVFFSVIIGPLWMLFHPPYPLILSIYLLGWSVYFAWASAQFSGKVSGRHFMAGLLSALLTQLVTMLVVSIAVLIVMQWRR